VLPAPERASESGQALGDRGVDDGGPIGEVVVDGGRRDADLLGDAR